MVASSQHSRRSNANLFSGVRQQVTNQALQAAQLAREQATELLQEQKQKAAREISSVGAAIRRAAERLEDRNSAGFITYFQSAADQIENAARYVEERDLTEVAEDLSTIARNRPALVIGGLFVAGLLAGRFISASTTTQSQSKKRRR